MLVDETAVSHVMMTADAVGGVWTYALELASQLARVGVRTTLATMGEPLRDAQRRAAAHVPSLEIVESAFKLEWMEDPWADVAAAGEWLLSLEERVRPDVVHLNGYAHGALPWRAPKVVVAHSCVLSWWKAVLGEPAPARYARYRREVARGLRSADAVVAPTRAMLAAVREHYGAGLRGTVIPNGVDSAGREAARKEPIVLAAGRLWDAAKNLRALAQAAPSLRWPVYVAGSTRGPDGGADCAAGAVHTLGWLDPQDLRAWMAKAAVYALPARYEPFGLSALEAALGGCALVLGDIPSLREVWAEAATYVPPDDVAALVETLERLAGDEPLRARKAIAARDRALRLSGERMAARYLRLYRNLVWRRSACATPRPSLPRSAGDGGGPMVQPCA